MKLPWFVQLDLTGNSTRSAMLAPDDLVTSLRRKRRSEAVYGMPIEKIKEHMKCRVTDRVNSWQPPSTSRFLKKLK